MLKYFKGFVGYTDDEFNELWKNAIFSVDTNVLLNFYKYTNKESTQILLDILKYLKEQNRLWITHQVALEYFFNYESNMFKPHEGYTLLENELKQLKENAQKILSSVKSKHPYIMIEKFNFFIDKIKKINHELYEQVNLELESLPESNKIKEEILSLLDGIIGEPYTQDIINEIEAEGKIRYESGVPPGYKDYNNKNKLGSRTYGDITYNQEYGDLLVWFQMIDRAKSTENPTPVIFITEEKKEDWWQRENGSIIRPHPHLIQEFLDKSNQEFYMYRTESFIKYANKYFNLDVTDEQVDFVIKDVEKVRQLEENEKQDAMQTQFFFNEDVQNESFQILDNVSVNSIISFFTDDEEKEFKKIFNSHIIANDFDGYDVDYYRDTIAKSLHKINKRVENKAKKILNEILEQDFDKGKYFLNKLPKSNDDVVKKTVLLINYIKEMESWLFENSLPF